jgi:hypothetical protein
MVVVQESSDPGMVNRSTVAERLFGILFNDVTNLMIDEAYFHLFGFVNKQNFRCWSQENLQQLCQRPLHSARVTGVE